MNAVEARNASIEPQFEAAMRDIDRAVGFGRMRSQICIGGVICKEVAEKLAKEGYDVKIVRKPDNFSSSTEASWELAEEGREGTITYVDESEQELQIIPLSMLESIRDKTLKTLEEIFTDGHRETEDNKNA